MERWFVKEFGILSRQEKSANIQVFGSFRVSIILLKVNSSANVNIQNTYCSNLKCLFSTPVWFSLIRFTAIARSSGERNHALVGESGKKNLEAGEYPAHKTVGRLPERGSDNQRYGTRNDHKPLPWFKLGCSNVRATEWYETWYYLGGAVHEDFATQDLVENVMVEMYRAYTNSQRDEFVPLVYRTLH